MKGYAEFKRWLYRGSRPHWIASILNRGWAALVSRGFVVGDMATLEVLGRKSQRVVSLPVVVAFVEGQRYLVSMLGESAQWVRNVRASGGNAVLRHGNREEIQLEEVPVGKRAPILKDYLHRAPGAQPHVPIDKDAPLKEFEAIAYAFPVFHIIPHKLA